MNEVGPKPPKSFGPRQNSYSIKTSVPKNLGNRSIFFLDQGGKGSFRGWGPGAKYSKGPPYGDYCI